MKNYVGRKCKGFRFKNGTDHIQWDGYMENYIGQVGEVVTQGENHVNIEFDNHASWLYPISLIEEHLIPESPEIPQLGEGVEMEVSNDGINWCKIKVLAQKHDGVFIDQYGCLFKHARPIQEVKKYTKEELVKILGHDFEMV